MPQQSQQANADGTFAQDFDPPHPRTVQERETPLRDGFQQRGWQVLSIASDDASRRTTLKVERGGHKYTIDAFVFPNLAWSSGGRSQSEKRIQLSRDYSEHAAAFSLPKTGERRCMLLGLYRRDDKTVICAWDAEAYKGHSNPSSCYVRVEAIADAMRNGMGQSVDGKDRLVCCFQPDLLPYYLENMEQLHERVMITADKIKAARDGEPEEGNAAAGETLDLGDPNPVPADLPRNRILYGAPGTGKSHLLDQQVAQNFSHPELWERVTFHPDYSYSQFVGAYRPAPLYREVADDLLASDKVTSAGAHEPLIDYRFVPGPLLRMLVKAVQNPQHNFALIIEELNRANAPAVFGEVFQLLDRDADGKGKFSVRLSPEAQDYLVSQGVSADTRLPRNLFLWATMNSADQGVLPLDAAFKRRWSFEYQPLNAAEGTTAGWMINLSFLPASIPWNDFRRVINDQLLQREIQEDRLIGPFFMREDELASATAFTNKLLLYLRDDVVRHNPDALFRGASLTYGALVEAYSHGQNIFTESVSFGPAGA